MDDDAAELSLSLGLPELLPAAGKRSGEAGSWSIGSFSSVTELEFFEAPEGKSWRLFMLMIWRRWMLTASSMGNEEYSPCRPGCEVGVGRPM